MSRADKKVKEAEEKNRCCYNENNTERAKCFKKKSQEIMKTDVPNKKRK